MRLSEIVLFIYLFDIFGVIIAVGLGGQYPDTYMAAIAHYLFWLCLLTLVVPVMFAGLVTAGLFNRFRKERKERYAV